MYTLPSLDFGIEELSGKTLIIGYGELGQAVAHIARAFGMRLLLADHKDKTPRPGRTAFDEVLSQADFIHPARCRNAQSDQPKIRVMAGLSDQYGVAG